MAVGAEDLAVTEPMQVGAEVEAQEAQVLLERPHQGLVEILLFKV